MLNRLLLTKNKIRKLTPGPAGAASRFSWVGLSFLLTLLLATAGLGTEDTAAEPNITSKDNVTRLSPDAFAELPLEIREALKTRGCTIPQAYVPESPHNVIQARFTKADTLDIAVLCSRDQKSSILVFLGGLAEEMKELASEPDRMFLQGGVDGDIWFSRRIDVISPQTIRKYLEWHGDEVPDLPPLDHDGIDDNFVGKASVIWYWREGQWMGLPGAD